jgi:tetratricopeptide (TPR) repeat protein
LGGGTRADQLPARDWNQVRQDWQTQRDQVRDDWQNYRDQARDDWQNWFDDHYPWHSGWYAGYGPGYWNRWDYLWDNYPVATAVGLTWWGANALGSQFGCGDYSNPYYTETPVANYSEPIVAPMAVASQEAAAPPGVPPEALASFEQARAAFLANDYEKALKLTDETVAKLPRDAGVHEFRSLVLFALGRYAESAAAIHAVLAAGPGWDAKTLIGLYSGVDVYTAHLRALEAYRNMNPKAADVRFLTGYHYLTGGYAVEAINEFKKAHELRPKDSVAAALVASLSARETPAAPAAAPASPAIAAGQMIGDWTAAGKGDSKYAMSLQKDGGFTWSFTRGVRKQQVKGVYTIEGNVLALEPDSGGVMLAELTQKMPGALHFKMIGNAADDPGLEFRNGNAN